MGLVAASLLVVAACVSCGGPTSPSAAATPTAAASEVPTAVPEIRLRRAPANLGCDTIRVPYRSVTFHIVPAAGEQVWAITNLGTQLTTFWSAGFVGDASAAPVIRDADGQVVATDGEVLAIPERDWPRLHGHFVCPGESRLYVLLEDPQ